MNSNLLQWNETYYVPDWFFIRLHGCLQGLSGPSKKKKRACGCTGTSTTPLICMVFFSSPSSFPVEKLVCHIHQRKAKIIREPVLLCVSLMRTVLSASLLFALLPFETAATWCYNTLVVFFSPMPSSGLLSCLCVTWLRLSPFALVCGLNSNRPDTDTLTLPGLWVKRFRFWPKHRGTLWGAWWFNKFCGTCHD